MIQLWEIIKVHVQSRVWLRRFTHLYHMRKMTLLCPRLYNCITDVPDFFVLKGTGPVDLNNDYNDFNLTVDYNKKKCEGIF